jgi:hypothetical protein
MVFFSHKIDFIKNAQTELKKYKMTDFIDETAILGKRFQLDDLPNHYKESTHIKDWKELSPDETTIYIPENAYIEDFSIQSHTDIEKIILADCMYGFHTKVYKEIFANIDEFWLENPNSMMITVPNKNQSWLARQIVVLLTEHRSNILMDCMKINLVELFDYIVEINDMNTAQLTAPMNIFPLLWYAVVNRHAEILIHGIKIGLPFTEELVRAAMKPTHTEIFKILLDNNIVITHKGEKHICEHAAPEIFSLFIDKYVSEKKDPAILLKHSIKNTKNFEELILNRDVSSAKQRDITEIYQIYYDCIVYSSDVKVLKMIEEYFEITNAEFQCEYAHGLNVIENQVLYEDNYDLFVYLLECGYEVSREHYDISVHKRCMKITPGFVKKYLN